MASGRRVRPRSQRSRPTRQRRLVVLAALLLAAAALVSLYWLWPTPGRIEQLWIEQAGFDPRIVHPDREANDAARRIEALIAPLGLQISPAQPIWVGSSDAAQDRYTAVRGEVRDYVRALRRIEPTLAAPPAALADFLRDIEPTLGQVAEVLGGDEPPRWEVRVGWLPDDILPNWMGHLDLHALLVATAAHAEHRGQTESARRRLEAAWRLRETLDDCPSVIAQLVAVAELHDELALLRTIPGRLPDWEHRLAPLPLRQRLTRAVRLDVWSLPGILRRYPAEGFFVEESAPPAALARLQARRGVAAAVASVNRAARRLESDEQRPSDAVLVVTDELERMPRWNLVAQSLRFTPMVGEVWLKAARAELNLELTRRALVVRELLRAGDAKGVEALGGEQASVVAGVSWIYTVDPEAVVIRAVGDTEPLPTEGASPSEICLSRSPGR